MINICAIYSSNSYCNSFLYQLCLGIIASGIGFVLRPARSVSRYRMDAMILG